MKEGKKGFDDALTRMKKRAEQITAKKKAAQKAKDVESRERANELAVVPIDITRYRNERNIMLYPLCSTSKRKRLTTINYASKDGKRWLEVAANHQFGMVKIWDFDILRYTLSKAGEIARITGIFPETVEFSGYECLKALGRKPTGTVYQWLRDALSRLASTTYRGNVFGDNHTTQIFTLIRVGYTDETKKLERIRITFDERLIESAQNNKGLLAINNEILHEEAGIKKRLLELVQVSKGNNPSWTVSLQRLQAMCAHEGALKRFKYELQRYQLPWLISFSSTPEGEYKVTFSDK